MSAEMPAFNGKFKEECAKKIRILPMATLAHIKMDAVMRVCRARVL